MHQRGPRSAHSTSRTCVGCRRRDDRSELFRVVAEQAERGFTAVPDPRHRLPGRGAWLHPLPACLELAVRRKAFGRALKVTAPLDLEPVRQWVQQITRLTQDSTTQDSTTAGREPG